MYFHVLGVHGEMAVGVMDTGNFYDFVFNGVEETNVRWLVEKK